MHHPMSGRDQSMVLKVAFQPEHKRSERILMRGPFCQILIDQRHSGAVFRFEMHTVPDALALAITYEALPARKHMARED
jgi:hypothetical protein